MKTKVFGLLLLLSLAAPFHSVVLAREWEPSDPKGWRDAARQPAEHKADKPDKTDRPDKDVQSKKNDANCEDAYPGSMIEREFCKFGGTDFPNYRDCLQQKRGAGQGLIERHVKCIGVKSPKAKNKLTLTQPTRRRWTTSPASL